jgi:hypothetical protein
MEDISGKIITPIISLLTCLIDKTLIKMKEIPKNWNKTIRACLRIGVIGYGENR